LLPITAVTAVSPTSELFAAADLIAEGNWSDSSQMRCTHADGGLDITAAAAAATVTVPLGITVNINRGEYLVLRLSGLPAGAEWNWVLEYRDRNGISGSVGAKEDFIPGENTGNYNGVFPFAAHFNWRKNYDPAAADLDMTNIQFTQLRFFADIPTAASFRIDAFYIASRTETGYTPPPVQEVRNYEGSSAWARADIAAADRAGLVPEDLLNHFRSPITRENFCRLAIAYVEAQAGMGIDEYLKMKNLTPAAPFADSSNPAVLAAAALDIVQGVGGNRFNPAGTITRAEAAVMLANACAAVGAETGRSPQTNYGDQSGIRGWARPHINFVSEMKIMGSASSYASQFSPDAVYSAEQAIVTFLRMGENVYYEFAHDPVMAREIAAALWKPEYSDGVFTGPSAVTGFDAYRNRLLTRSMPSSVGRDDVKHVFHAGGFARVANLADGYAVTLPKPFTPDYKFSALRSRYTGRDYILNITTEDIPWDINDESGWRVYRDNNFSNYIGDDSFLRANNLSRTRPVQVNTSILPGYTVEIYSIRIDGRPNIEHPFYNIATIRRNGQFSRFLMLHYKSEAEDNARFDAIVRSYKAFTPEGFAKNDERPFTPVIPASWNAETRAYYNKLRGQNTVDWGVFTWPQTIAIQKHYRNSFEHNLEIMPTAAHLGDSLHLAWANEIAGGNGFNVNPVMHFTYQFTVSNNTNLSGYTPMFDIINGNYDGTFRQLARDIKAYGKPVLFRLNNEMDTDHTSYSALVSLLDTDIFVQSWERLYRIFNEEGADNCIWVFNPDTASHPPQKWSSWLNYLPDISTVHMLGVTSYEMNNYGTIRSFADRYRDQYYLRVPYFQNFPWGIGEFACGSGGEMYYTWHWHTRELVSGELHRNKLQQAEWVRDMFTVLNDLDNPDNYYAKNIKYAVWFASNDDIEVDGRNYIRNSLRLTGDLSETFEQFRLGFGGRNSPGVSVPAGALVDYLTLHGIHAGSTGGGDNQVTVSENPGGGLRFTHSGVHGWPHIGIQAITPLFIPRDEWSSYTLHYDFTVSHQASIGLFGVNTIRFTNYILNDYNTAADMGAGTYRGSIGLADFLAAFNYNELYFAVGGLQVYVVGPGGATVTIREMRIER
jgi:hypothetical protein